MRIKNRLKLLLKVSLLSLPGVIGLLFGIHFDLITNSYHNIDPTFQPIYNSFLNEASQRGFNKLHKIDINIQFSDIDQTKNKGTDKMTLGECEVIIGKTPEIRIDKNLWFNMNPSQREMTVFHELGHCFLLKGHTNADHDKIESLMNSEIFDEQVYLTNRSKFLDELFSYRPYHIKDYTMTFFVIPAIKIAKKKLLEN